MSPFSCICWNFDAWIKCGVGLPADTEGKECFHLSGEVVRERRVTGVQCCVLSFPLTPPIFDSNSFVWMLAALRYIFLTMVKDEVVPLL